MCDMHAHFSDGQFDAVVCYGGPLSYVFGERDRAIAELLRVTKSGGLLFLGVMSLWGTVHHFLPEVLKVDYELNKDIIASGDLDPQRPEAGTHFCHLYRAAEFREFLEQAGAEIVAMSASDCLTATWAGSLEEILKEEKAWGNLIEMEIEACRQPGCLDMGTHLIAVCRKL
jgi:SAM-dependent methyltransferase